jgi:glycosyltransferase involved in cell wall biosynthesis
MCFHTSINRTRKVVSAVINRLSGKAIYYVVEGYGWSVDHDGRSIMANLTDISFAVTTTHYGIRNSIAHFGSINTFMTDDRLKLPHKSNKIVVTWFHFSPGDKRVELIPQALEYVGLWHTSCNIARDKLIEFGIPKEKITVIPLGVSLNVFSVPTSQQKESVRSKLGISKGKVVIGSFQKDGDGWGRGLKPKLIKGPDIFCDVIEQLQKQYDLFVLLTGPARGYVKGRLEKAGVPYLHRFLTSLDELAEYYKAIDLYIVASRQEGGPKSILESLASGVPLVTAKVGMAPDVITDGVNGFLTSVGDVGDIAKKASYIIENRDLRNEFRVNGLKTVKNYDWPIIASLYRKNIYCRVSN